MKKTILFAMLLAWNFSSFAFNWEETRSHSFNVNPNDVLEISHKFGQLELIEDPTVSAISLDYVITISGANEKEVKEYLKGVNLRFLKEGNVAKAETNVSGTFNNVKLNVRATVRIPNTVYCHATVKYGDLITDKLTKNFDGEVKFGNVSINELKGRENSLDVSYGNLKLGKASFLELEVAYSGSTKIDSLENAEIDSEYSTLSISFVKRLSVDSKFDNYRIGKAGKVETEMEFTEFYIGNLLTSFATDDCRYGKIKIHDIAANFSQIAIKSSYTPIYLNMMKKNSCRIAVTTSYASIKTNKDLLMRATLQNDNCLVGVLGENSNPSANLKVESSFGDVKLFAD